MDRIRQLREERGIKQPELGKVLNVRGSAISKYENEKIPLTADAAKKLSEYFNVSIDYLLGYSEFGEYEIELTRYPTDEERLKVEQGYFFRFFGSEGMVRVTFLKRLASAIADAGMDNETFTNTISIGAERAAAIMNGKQDPSANDLIEISRCLNVSIDYLLGQIPALSSAERKLLNTFVELDEDNKDILIGKAKELLQNQRYQSSVAADVPLREAK